MDGHQTDVVILRIPSINTLVENMVCFRGSKKNKKVQKGDRK